MESKSIIAALNQKLSSDAFDVVLSSSDEKLTFRPITVGEQKTFSKIILGNRNDADTIYNATISLLKTLCLNKEKFDTKVLTEIDRIKILVEFCRRNYYLIDTKSTCTNPECKNEILLKFDFDLFAKQLDDIGKNNKDVKMIFKYNDKNIEFMLGFPTIDKMAEVEKIVKNEDTSDMAKALFDDSDVTKVDPRMLHLSKLFSSETTCKAFVKSVKIEEVKQNSEKPEQPFEVDFSSKTLQEQIEICNALPFAAFYSTEDNNSGVFQFISEHFVSKLLGISQDITCPKCQTVMKGGLSLQIFFI